MLVWILIAACWTGLLLLILHDATKDADGVSPVSVASRSALISTAKGWRRLRKFRPIHKLRLAYATAAKASPSPKAAPSFEAAAAPEAAASSSEAAPSSKVIPSEAPAQASPATIPLQATEVSKKAWWRKDRRVQITPAELELTIAEAVRKNAPECGSFVGVIVHHKKPKQHRDPNWGVRGVRFGKADRRIVNETLTRIVEQLQKEFRLVDPQLRN